MVMGAQRARAGEREREKAERWKGRKGKRKGEKNEDLKDSKSVDE